jgi:hypothetical protein
MPSPRPTDSAALPINPPLSPGLRALQFALVAFIVVNTIVFLTLAVLNKLPGEGKALVFIDFWGRFTVYSLWFIAYALYRRFAWPVPALRVGIAGLVVLNIPFFLLMAYFDKISNAPATLALVDFWGRISVYSLWFIGYEVYRRLIARERGTAAV